MRNCFLMTPEIEQRHADLQKTVDKLSNGHRGDPLAMSEGIVNISKTLQVMLMMNFVTKDECRHSNGELLKEFKKKHFGWKHLSAVLVACSVIFGLGVHLIDTIWEPTPIITPEVIITHSDVNKAIDANNVTIEQTQEQTQN